MLKYNEPETFVFLNLKRQGDINSMPKKLIKRIFLILIPIALVLFAVITFDKYLSFKISSTYSDEVIGKIGELEARDKGIELLRLDSLKNHLFLVGSSELRSSVPQNPKNMFPNTDLNSNITILGMPLVQCLQDATRFGGGLSGENLQCKNICLMISMQWFMRKEGITENEFKPHFSPIQFYKFLKNEKISEESKKYLCERVKSLIPENNTSSPFFEEALYAKLYQRKFLKALFSPYYYLKEKFLTIKDKYNAFKLIKKYKNLPQTPEIKKIDWETENEKAYQEGKNACTTNKFFMSDSDWNGCMAEVIDSLEMVYKDIDLQNSKEYDDLNLLFDVCKQCEIKPYVIILSNNGFYYDYTGLDSEKRNKFYNRIENACKDYGFDYLKLNDKEYEPYFFRDGMHLGWKGWLYVNKKITEYYSKA